MTWQHLTAEVGVIKNSTKSDSEFPDYIQVLIHSTLHSHSMDQMISPNLYPLTNPRWALKCYNQTRGALPPRYFHATNLTKSKPDALLSSYRMSWPLSQLPQPQGSTQPPQLKIAEYYDELLADPSLVPSFPADEWTSINKLPCLLTLHFWVVLKGLFTKLVTPELWGQAGVDFTVCSGKKVRSKEIMPMAILITDGVGEGKLGMVTIFCCSDHAKVEPSVMIPTLIQQDSHELAMVVMKIFNSPYFPRGSFGLSFLDIGTLSEGTPTIQFPLS